MVSQPCIFAISNPGALGLLLITAAILAGSFASISACILLPRPEMRMTMDFMVPAAGFGLPGRNLFYLLRQSFNDCLSFICVALPNRAYAPHSFPRRLQKPHRAVGIFRRYDQHHADAAIKHAMHFTISHVALLLQPAKKRGRLPCFFFQYRSDTVGQDTRDIFH